MIKHNQDGGVSGLGISLVMTVILLVGALGFGGWAFMSRNDYKTNVDSKIADAVTIAKQQEGSAKDKQFAEDEKQPLRTYSGPEAFGSIQASYPKTWSGFVDDTGKSSNALLDGYFYPNIVPSIAQDAPSVFSLRMVVTNQSYAQTLATIMSQSSSNNTGVVPPTISPYALPKVPKAIGIKLVGTLPLQSKKQGEMVVLPLRDKTLQIWSETAVFTPDFETNILPNFTFSP
jgi:hypothetical protein